MPVVRHGKMDLKWCKVCKVPVLEGKSCPGCDGPVLQVKYTPPGDIRPAFPFDIDQVTSLIDSQWGDGAAEYLQFEGYPIIMNPCPSPDRLEEIIHGGHVVASIIYSPESLSSSLILKEEGGRLLQEFSFKPERGYVVADASAVPFLLDGKNLLSPGIIDCSDDIKPGDEVLVVDPDMKIIASGPSRKMSGEMVGTKGMGVKIRWAIPPWDGGKKCESKKDLSFQEIWKRVININGPLLDHKVRTSIRFIKNVMKDEGMEAAVSYSGGKDSLATLLLTIDAGFELPIMFINTGIEFPETVRHVHDLAEELKLDLIEGAPRTSFYDNIEKFGPPGRDYRWCCKSCKLGPMTDLIRNRFPEGVLTFIGQRRFESDSRERKGAVWKNPWVPNQKGASPVQDWTALDVWLYIFSKDVSYNILYEKGFQRIGCWLCPSCDLAEQELVEGTEMDPGTYQKVLVKEREERDLPEEWLTYGFHRFKKLPPHMRELATKLGIEEELKGSGRSGRIKEVADFVDGYGSCVDGLSLEGVLGNDIDQTRLRSIINILGPVTDIEGTGGFEVRPLNWKMKRAMLEVYPDGTLVIRGIDHNEIKQTRKVLTSVLKRTDGCIGCMICLGRCERSAITTDDTNQIVIDPDLCIHCGKCLGLCPAESYERDPYDI